MSRKQPNDWSNDQLLEYAKARLEGCRKGGERSGEKRRETSRRDLIEHAIRNRISVGEYNRNAASKIARYLDVSPRYVRRLATAMKKTGKVT